MNTTFFEKASNLSKDFSWKDIFSDVFKPHTREDRSRLMLKGMGNHVPSPAQMLRQWQKPWLFVWAGAIGLIIALISMLLWNSGAVYSIPAMMLVLFIVPAFVVPLAVLIFFWEMDMTGSTSILDTLLMMLVGGILSIAVTGIFHAFITLPFGDEAYIGGPLPEEIAKFLVVWLLLSRKKFKYGIQGILVGGAVGVGFSAIESAYYAWMSFMQQLDVVAAENAFEGMMSAMFGGDGTGITLATQAMTETILTRGILAIGGHVLWAALYGGALGLLKHKGRLGLKSLADPLVIMTFSGAFLLHTVWNFSGAAFLGILPDGVVLFLLKLDAYYVKYILLIVLGWLLLLFVMRKCIRQMAAVEEFYNRQPGNAGRGGTPAARPAEAMAVGRAILTVRATGQLNHGKAYELSAGGSLIFGRDPQRANVSFPPDTKGVSGLHCEIKIKEGVPVLIDRNSTYGTFFSNGSRLEPNVPYKIKGHVKFYLAKPENQFDIQV